MLKKRLIACLLLKNGYLVKTRNFGNYQVIGSPRTPIELFNRWSVDEIVLLDLSRTEKYNLDRSDINYENPDSLEGIISYIAQSCFIPLTVGGGIHTIDDIRKRLKYGADKVVIDTEALVKPGFINESAKIFGKQCIVVSVDAKKKSDGSYEVFVDLGKQATGRDPIEWAREIEQRGGGEILLNSIDKDGTMMGYDVDLIQKVSKAVSIPVIALGGAGEWQDFVDAVKIGNASAVAAANIFYFREQSTRMAKKHMKEAGIDVRFTAHFVPKLSTKVQL